MHYLLEFLIHQLSDLVSPVTVVTPPDRESIYWLYNFYMEVSTRRWFARRYRIYVNPELKSIPNTSAEGITLLPVMRTVFVGTFLNKRKRVISVSYSQLGFARERSRVTIIYRNSFIPINLSKGYSVKVTIEFDPADLHKLMEAHHAS